MAVPLILFFLHFPPAHRKFTHSLEVQGRFLVMLNQSVIRREQTLSGKGMLIFPSPESRMFDLVYTRQAFALKKLFI